MSGDPNNRFLWAVRRGDLETATSLHASYSLSHKKVWSQSYNLLRKALQEKREEVAKFLLKCGAKVNSNSKRQLLTPLHYAIKNRYVEVVDMLLKRDANVSVNDISSGTPLYCAVQEKNLEIVKLLLKKKPQLNLRSGREGMTPLHLAVELGEKEITKLLVDNGFDVNAACTLSWKEGNTPLHYAAVRGDDTIAEFLLSKGADVNAKAKDDSTPLHAATKMNRDKVMKLLFNHGANVDAQNKDGYTALRFAIENNNLSLIKLILEFGPDSKNKANLNAFYYEIRRIPCGPEKEIIQRLLLYGFAIDAEASKDWALLHAAVRNGYLNIVKTFLNLNAGVNINAVINKGETLLHTVAKNKRIDIAKFLIEKNADINAKDGSGKTPIHNAVENSDLDMTKLLLATGAKVRSKPSLLHAAVKTLRKDIVQMIFDHEPSINVNAVEKLNGTALFCTVVAADTESDFSSTRSGRSINRNNVECARRDIAEILLERGARVNAKTRGGSTVLHVAAELGYRKVVQLFLEYDAKVNIVDKKKWTPLHSAAVNGYESIVKLLLKSGANVGAKNKDGRTALHLAVKQDNEKIVKVLLENGADVGDRDKTGATSLHIAAMHHTNILEILLDEFDDIDCKDAEGRTALHLAAKHGQFEMVCQLLNCDADINIACDAGKTPFDYVSYGMAEPRIIHDLFDGMGFDDDDAGIADAEFVEPEFGGFIEAQLGIGFDEYDYYRHVYDDMSDYEDYDDYFDLGDDDDDDESFFSESSYSEIADALQRHMAKLQALNRFLNKKNLYALELFWNKKMVGVCSFQVNCMKEEQLGDSNVTLYDILTKGMNQLMLYARNESIVAAVEETMDRSIFDLYTELIETRFRKALKRSALLDPSSKSLNWLFGYALPELATFEMLNYLSNKDLKNLIKAYPGDDF